MVEHLVARGDAGKALALLRRPDIPRELVYKFAPALMAAAPAATIDACLAVQPPLDPRFRSLLSGLTHMALGPCIASEDQT